MEPYDGPVPIEALSLTGGQVSLRNVLGPLVITSFQTRTLHEHADTHYSLFRIAGAPRIPVFFETERLRKNLLAKPSLETQQRPSNPTSDLLRP